MITFFDLFAFIVRNCLPFSRRSYVEKHLLVFNKLQKDQEKAFKDFTTNHLKPDVILVYRILSNNVNSMVVSELVKSMWESYVNNYKLEKVNVKKHRKEHKGKEENFSDTDDHDTIPKFPVSSSGDENSQMNAVRQEQKVRTRMPSSPINPSSSV
jgi:hypothetical protein